MVVLDEGSFLGILTPSDIVESQHQLVIDCLHDKPYVNFEQDIESVLMLMKESRNSVLTVFDGNRFIGVVTQAAITDYLFEFRNKLKRVTSEHTAELTKINEQLKREIEKRMQIEEALLKANEELEEKYRQVISTITDAIMTFDADTKQYIEVNKACEDLYGYSREDFLTLRHYDITAEPELTDKAITETLQGKLKYIPIRYHRKKDGTVFPVELSVSTFNLQGRKVLCGVIRDITERRQAEEQLRTSSEQLRALSAHLQSIREEERKMMAREIHDELAQVLTVLKMEFRSLSDRSSKKQEGGVLDAESINQLIDRAIDTSQRVCMELRPAIVDELGLSAAIEWQAKEIEKRSNIKCKITFEPQEILVDKEHSIALFRIFQELLNNVVRHAQATKIKIHLKEKRDRIILSIKDNGIGIADEQISDFKSLGLVGIRERAQFLGGSFAIRGIKKKGTTVTISIPLKPSEM